VEVKGTGFNPYQELNLMMPEANQIAVRRQIAKDVASEAIKALFSKYWADSFELNRLEERLTEDIFFFTRNALPLEECSTNLNPLSQKEDASIAPSQEIPDHPSHEA
jgi:hypothetical protein